MKRKKEILLSLAIWVLFSSLLFGQSTLEITPANIQVLNDETFVVTVNSTSATPQQSLSGATVFLSFNPSILEVQDVTAGLSLDVAILPTSANNATGQISYNNGTFGDTSFGNNVLLFTVTFKALATSAGTPIQFTSNGGIQTNLAFNGNSVLSGTSNANVVVNTNSPDGDGDGIADDEDNCPEMSNADQADLDNDGTGNVCDDDADGDGITNDVDCNDLNAGIGLTTTWYADTDGDGFGDASDMVSACMQPTGYVVDNTDCDDGDGMVYPGAQEIQDGIDNDCDGEIDEEFEGCTADGYIIREIWTVIGGSNVADIPLDTPPNSHEILYNFEGSRNILNQFGSRIRGYICPPQSGEYTFWIAGDNNSELHLSTDDQPANKSRIAKVPGWTYPNEWTKYVNQKSKKIRLEQGQRYYVEVLHKELSGGDNISVGWQMPDMTMERPMLGMYLSPFEPDLRNPDNPAMVGPGVESYYYEGNWNSIPDFSLLDFVSADIDDMITISKRLRNDEFGFKIEGFIDVPEDAYYTLFLVSDDGSKLYIGDRLVVDNDGLHAPKEKSGIIGLKKGLHQITIEFFEKHGGEALEVYWSGKSFSKEMIPATSLFNDGLNLELRPPDNPSDVTQGVEYYYYKGEWNSLPEFGSAYMLDYGIENNFSLDNRLSNNLFGMEFRGFIQVDEPGHYSFITGSDDGSQLFIGNELVVDNDGLHGYREKSGVIGLEAGLHEIRVVFFEKHGVEQLNVFWNRVGMPAIAIPDELLFNDGIDFFLRPADNSVGVVSGVNYKYYQGDWNWVPDFETMTAEKEGNANNFDLAKGNRSDLYGFEYHTYIEVPQDGHYLFTLGSDDGSQLWIGDQLIVDNDGLHAYKEVMGGISLEAGKHELTVRYFEKYADAFLNVYWQSNNFPNTMVPNEVLYRMEMPTNARVEAETLGKFGWVKNALSNPDVNLYPNPVENEYFNLKFDQVNLAEHDLKLYIIGLEGKIHEIDNSAIRRVGFDEIEVDLLPYRLPSAVYVLKMDLEGYKLKQVLLNKVK